MSDWVNKTHRWVNKDAKPIALVRENGSQYYLDYVFDISDTNSFGKREIKLWKYDDKYENTVIQTVTNARNENIQTNETAVEYDEGTYIGNKNSKKYTDLIAIRFRQRKTALSLQAVRTL